MEVQTNYGKHLCIFEPDDKEGYIVTVPGLPGTVTWGKTISQAKKMAQEAIELCVECFVRKAAAFKKKDAPREFVKQASA
jgi:predicted RNase H-like HicB family nuclease